MSATSRRALLAQAGSMLALASTPGLAATGLDFAFPGGNGARPLVKDFPQKGTMVLQRSRPPLLETPFTDFDSGVFTPNEKFFVRWHWAPPSEIDPASFRLKIRGQVERAADLDAGDPPSDAPRHRSATAPGGELAQQGSGDRPEAGDVRP